jgi:Fungal protein of unknown function (DUF1748)
VLPDPAILPFRCSVRAIDRAFSPRIKTENLGENSQLKTWVDNYLWVGEVVMDQSVALMSTSGYFERKRE